MAGPLFSSELGPAGGGEQWGERAGRSASLERQRPNMRTATPSQ